jgi:hypothetical protein
MLRNPGAAMTSFKSRAARPARQPVCLAEGSIEPATATSKCGRSTSSPSLVRLSSGIWVVPDELGLLCQLGAIKLA